MFIPIGDDNRDRKRYPFVNYLLILANIYVFIFWQQQADNKAADMGSVGHPTGFLTTQHPQAVHHLEHKPDAHGKEGRHRTDKEEEPSPRSPIP